MEPAMQGPEVRRASRSSLWTGIVLLASVLLGGWFFIEFVSRTGERLERLRVQSLAATAAASLDPGRVAALQGSPTDAGGFDFEALRSQLKRIHDVNPDFRFVYLMRPRPDKPEQMLFLADAEPSNSTDYSAPGDPYDGPSTELFSVYRTGRPAIQEPYRDRWGYWVTVVAPIREARTGAVVAVLGMDINARSWIANMARYRAFAITISSLALALVLLFILTLRLQAGPRPGSNQSTAAWNFM
jgi:hypothetical protein